MQNLFTSHASTTSQSAAEVLKAQLQCTSSSDLNQSTIPSQPNTGHGLFCFCVEEMLELELELEPEPEPGLELEPEPEE